jgi:hypothetical protein
MTTYAIIDGGVFLNVVSLHASKKYARVFSSDA